MFNIDKKIATAMGKYIRGLSWDYNLTEAARLKVDSAVEGFYDTIEDKVERLINKGITDRVNTELDKQLNDPKYLKKVVASLRELQLQEK